MRNLIPEIRTDKNGVTSTKWVKPTSAPSFAGEGIPMPIASASKPLDLYQEVTQIKNLLHADDNSVLSRTTAILLSNLHIIGEHDMSLLMKIKQVASAGELEAKLMKHLLKKDGNFAYVTDPGFSIEHAIDNLRTATYLMPLCSRLEQRFGDDIFDLGGEGFLMMQSVWKSVQRSSGSGLDEERTTALGLIVYIRGAYEVEFDEDDNFSYADIVNEVDYIVEHLDEVESLLPELHARKAFDQETIESFLRAPSQAVRSGLL